MVCACGHRWDDLFASGREPDAAPCPKCGGRKTVIDAEAERADFVRTHRRRSGISERRCYPFASESMGVLHDSERIAGQDYTRDNALIVKSPQHRSQMMKELGLIDRRDFKGVGQRRKRKVVA
jgi:hypothetical protein